MHVKKLLRFSIFIILVFQIVLTLGGIFDLFRKKGRGSYKQNCNCPCREYWVTKCEIVGVEEKCRNTYNNIGYGPHHRRSRRRSNNPYSAQQQQQKPKCDQSPVIKPKKVRMTECQQCQRFYGRVLDIQVVRQCAPLYDEKCHTKYPRHCAEELQCTMIYTTECEHKHYKTQCQQKPTKTCRPVTKCHRTPKTRCHPVTTNACKKVPQPVRKEEMQKKCSPYDETKRVQSQNCNGITPLQLLSRDSSALDSLVPEVRVSPINGIKLALSGIGEKEVRQTIIQQEGLSELAALSPDGMSAPDMNALIGALAGGSGGAGGANMAALLAAVQSGQITPEQIAAFQAGGGNVTPAQLAALQGAGSGTGGITPEQIAAFQALQGSSSNGGATNGITPAQIAALQGATGNSGAAATGGITPAQLAAFQSLQQNSGGSSAGGINVAQLAALQGGGGISPEQLSALQSAGGLNGINPAQLAALQGAGAGGTNGINAASLAALQGANAGGANGINPAQLAALQGLQGSTAASAGGFNAAQLAMLQALQSSTGSSSTNSGYRTPPASTPNAGGINPAQLGGLNAAQLAMLQGAGGINPAQIAALQGAGAGGGAGLQGLQGLTPAQLSGALGGGGGGAATTGQYGGNSFLNNLSASQIIALQGLTPAQISALQGGGSYGTPRGAPTAPVLPPGVSLPPGITLPPGVSLPPGVQIPGQQPSGTADANTPRPPTSSGSSIPGLPPGVTLPPGFSLDNLPPGVTLPPGINTNNGAAGGDIAIPGVPGVVIPAESGFTLEDLGLDALPPGFTLPPELAAQVTTESSAQRAVTAPPGLNIAGIDSLSAPSGGGIPIPGIPGIEIPEESGFTLEDLGLDALPPGLTLQDLGIAQKRQRKRQIYKKIEFQPSQPISTSTFYSVNKKRKKGVERLPFLTSSPSPEFPFLDNEPLERSATVTRKTNTVKREGKDDNERFGPAEAVFQVVIESSLMEDKKTEKNNRKKKRRKKRRKKIKNFKS